MPVWDIELASTIRRAQINWLWPGYLPRGKLALLDGDPEMGKSLLTVDLIARLSRGDSLPDGSTVSRPCTSIMISAEDDAGDTICPRAVAARADMNRLVIPDFHGRLPRFPQDMPDLEELIRACSADLVVIDPLMAFLPPSVTANLDQCVRQVLTPLAAVASRTGCTILLVRHLIKRMLARALLRGQGSMGIVAAVRTAFLVAVHPDDPTARVLAVMKNNVGRRPPALGFRIVESPAAQPVIEWTGPVDQTADGLCQRKVATMVKASERAIDWLRRELADGPRKAAELYAAAAATGIPERTLRRAKKDLPARSHRVSHKKSDTGEWYWYDPDSPWPKNAPFKKPYDELELPQLPWATDV
jgi:hypothetical protein